MFSLPGHVLFWIVALVIFLVVEAVSAGLVSIWFAAGALAALICAALKGPLWLQAIWFVVVSCVTLILTRPLNAQPGSLSRALAVHALQKEYPKTAEAIAARGALYAEGIKKALALQEEGKVLIVAPDDIGNLKTLTKDAAVLDKLYKKGFRDARNIRRFIST